MIAEPAPDREALIIEAFRGNQLYLTLGQLRARTALSRGELLDVLQTLKAAGRVARLNTVLESYVLRDRAVNCANQAITIR